jgi:hypothetical protein
VSNDLVLASFARDLRISLSPAARSADIAAVATVALAAAEVVNRAILGRVPSHRTTVDGRAGAALESVRPNGGRIEFEFDFIDPELLHWISDQLHRFSPVRSGRYQRSHILLADGVEVDPTGTIPQAREFVFINSQPYARAIERGLSPQRPEGVYQAVAALARRRSNLDISFGYRPLVDAGEKWMGAQPAIVIQGMA